LTFCRTVTDPPDAVEVALTYSAKQPPNGSAEPEQEQGWRACPGGECEDRGADRDVGPPGERLPAEAEDRHPEDAERDGPDAEERPGETRQAANASVGLRVRHHGLGAA
jgi:hypothetical protein